MRLTIIPCGFDNHLYYSDTFRALAEIIKEKENITSPLYSEGSDNTIWDSTRKKGTLRVGVGKFIGFYLEECGIKANLDKCEVIVKMKAKIIIKKDVMKLNGMFTATNMFITRFSQHISERNPIRVDHEMKTSVYISKNNLVNPIRSHGCFYRQSHSRGPYGSGKKLPTDSQLRYH